MSGIENVLTRAVVLFELNNFCFGIIALKIEYILKVSAPPGVNSLPIITDHTDIAIFSSKHFNQLILGVICILILVDQNVWKLILPLFKELFVFKQLNGLHNNVVKIESRSLRQSLLIKRIHFCCNFLSCAARMLSIITGTNKLILRRRYQPCNQVRVKLLLVDPELPHCLLDCS